MRGAIPPLPIHLDGVILKSQGQIYFYNIINILQGNGSSVTITTRYFILSTLGCFIVLENYRNKSLIPFRGI
jgi:hypothetical protein